MTTRPQALSHKPSRRGTHRATGAVAYWAFPAVQGWGPHRRPRTDPVPTGLQLARVQFFPPAFQIGFVSFTGALKW